MTDSNPIEVPAEGGKAPGPVGWTRWRHFPVLCLAVWCVAGVLLRSGPTSTVLTSPSSYADFMVPVSGAWALASGMHIHKDFSTPLGLAYYLPYYWALEIFGDSASVVRHVESAIFVVFSVVTFLLLRPPRYSWAVTALGVGLTSLLAANPGLLGNPPTVVYEGLAYNYVGIAAGYLCLLTAMFPPLGDAAGIKRREIGDALLLAAGLVWVTFVKVNYLAQNVVFLLAAITLYRITQGKRSGWFYGTLAGGFLVLALLFVLVFRVDVGGMLRDVRMAASCRSNWVLARIALSDGFGQGRYVGLSGLYMHAERALTSHQSELTLLSVALLGGLALVAALGGTCLRRVAAYTGLMVVVLACDIFQGIFNTYGGALPMLPLLWLLLMCVLERGECIREGAATAEKARLARGWVSRLAAVTVGYHIVLLAIGHVTAFVYNSGLSERAGKDLASPVIRRDEAFQACGWEHLYYAVPVGEENTVSYVTKINDGLALLRNNRCEQERIFVMDQVNPFPFLLRAPYPAGQPAWLHVEATFNKQTHLPVETLLKGAEVIMIPKQPLNPLCLYILADLYESYVKTNYVLTAQTDQWQLYQNNIVGMKRR